MLQQLLREFEAVQARYGEQRQPPCTDDRLEQLRRRMCDDIGAELPDEYAAFLRTQDGLNHNGLCIYASETAPVVGATNATIEGVVEANLAWRDDEHLAAYLVFGEGNMDLYVRHLPTGAYQVIDRVPGYFIEAHASFSQLLAAALRAHL
jgi:hypothetical protein